VKSLTLPQAAAFLKIHPVTLQAKVRQGILPGAKVGRRWVFLEDDLAAYVRSKYPANRQALQGDGKEVPKCHSTDGKGRRIGGSGSPIADDEYSRALGLRTERKPSNTMTD
jgi:excisionase family DNA binding protein